MRTQLVGTIQRNERSHRNHAAVPFGQAGTLPDIAKKYAVGKVSKLWCNVSHKLLSA